MKRPGTPAIIVSPSRSEGGFRKGFVKIPYIDFVHQHSDVRSEVLAAMAGVLDRGQYILGSEVQDFEKEFAAYVGTQFAVGVSSGTSALYLALRALGIGRGDEVITVSNSYIATATAVVLAGAEPVFVDIGPDLNIDPTRVEEAVTPRTRAVIPVHLTGRPASMHRLVEVAKSRDLAIIEDAAHAVGAELDGKRAGAFGEIACFSLHPLKNLHALGDAGIVTTDREDLKDALLQLRNLGLVNRDECVQWSPNCRLDEIHAAVLRTHLRHLEKWTQERRKLAKRYNELLRSYVKVPEEAPGEKHVYQTYMIQADRRDDLATHLLKHGVEAKIHYPIPIHRQKVAASLTWRGSLPRTDEAATSILSLPLYPGLTDAQQGYVSGLFREFYGG